MHPTGIPPGEDIGLIPYLYRNALFRIVNIYLKSRETVKKHFAYVRTDFRRGLEICFVASFREAFKSEIMRVKIIAYKINSTFFYILPFGRINDIDRGIALYSEDGSECLYRIVIIIAVGAFNKNPALLAVNMKIHALLIKGVPDIVYKTAFKIIAVFALKAYLVIF